MTWKVNFYLTKRGDNPVRDFASRQDLNTGSKIASAMELLIKGGPYLKPPHIKKIQDKLYELRIPGKASVRIFYTISKSEYYLLHAFKKKSQKTPKRELKIALDRMRDII